MKKLFLFGIASLVPSVVFAAPWDFLRGPTEFAQAAIPVVAWIVMVIALGVAIVSFLALRKKKSKRLLFVSAAFGLFFIKTVLNLADLYYSPGSFMNAGVQGIFDLLIIGALFTALFRK